MSSDRSREDDTALRHTLDVIEGRAAADPKLIEELRKTIEQHRPRVYAVCNRIVRNPEVAEELTQDALIIAYRKLSSFEGKSSLSTWLCGIAKHVALNAVRKHGELLTEDGMIEAEDAGVSVLRVLSRHERNEVMRDATAQLTPQEQEVVFLRYVENLPHEAIESMLGLEEGNSARVVLQRVKRQLHKRLTERLAALGHGMSFVRTRE